MSRMLPLVKLIATGGTIAMKKDPITKAPVPAVDGEGLLAAVPGITEVATIEVDDFSNQPSDYISLCDWVALYRSVTEALARADIAGVIIAHGTDTLEETAYFLDLTINNHKPIIVVGALRNASEPDYDGPRNLLNAARVTVCPEARGNGVLVVMNNQIHVARDVSKTHTHDVESFKSGDYGFLGHVDDDRVVFHRSPSRRQHLPLQGNELPRVDIIAMYVGADGSMVQAAVDAGAKGIVVQALGPGNVNHALFAAIKQALAAGVTVAISTRVLNGRVLPTYGFEGGGQTLKEAGAIFADNLSPQKARILLMLALQANTGSADMQTLFNR